MTHSEIHSVAEIVGRAWGGFRAVYSYSLPEPVTTRAQADKVAENIGRIAGDFQSVDDVRIVTVTHTYNRKAGGLFDRCDHYRTLRGFRHGMTPQRFYRLANGY